MMTPKQYLRTGRELSTPYGKIFTYSRNFEGTTVSKDPEKTITLLFLHGFPTSSYDFLPLMDYLESKNPKVYFRFIAFDFLGLGFSDKPADNSYPISIQTDILELVIQEYKLDRFSIVTHDYGVTVAQEFLSRYKDNSFRRDFYNSIFLEKVTFLNGGLFPETHRARLIQKIMATSLAPIVMPFFKRKQFGRSFSSVFGADTRPTTEELDSLWEILQYNNGHKMTYKLLSYIQQRRDNRERWVDSIVNPPVPIRLINGNVDPISGFHMVSRYEELTGRRDSVHLSTIGHYPQVEDVNGVGEAIVNFFFEMN